MRIKDGKKVNNYIFCIIALYFFIPTSVLGQKVDLESDKNIFIQPMVGLDFAFFDPSESRMQDQNLKDIEEFFTYGFGLGYEWEENMIVVSFSTANDVDAWDKDQSSLPKGYRYFDSYYQTKLSFSKLFYTYNLSEKTKVKLGADGGFLFRKYNGQESLGASENFRTKKIELNDFSISISSLITLDFNRTFGLMFTPIGVNFGSKATTYEVSKVGLNYQL